MNPTAALRGGRRRWAGVAWAFGVAATLVLASVPARADVLRLGIPALPQFAPLLIAEQRGYFAAEGLTVALSHCLNGKTCLQRLTGGEVHVTAALDLPVALAVQAGARVDIVAALGTSSAGNELLVREDRGIRSAADLKGKRITYVPGTGGHYFLHAFLRLHQVELASVTPVPLQPAEAVAALLRGDVDAAALYQPYPYEALRAGGRMLRKLDGARATTVTAVLISRSAAQGVSDGDLQRLLRAVRRAQLFMAEDPARAKALLTAALRWDAGIYGTAYDEFDFRLSLPQALLEALEAKSRWAVREGLAAKGPVPDFLERVRRAPLVALDPRAVTMAP